MANAARPDIHLGEGPLTDERDELLSINLMVLSVLNRPLLLLAGALLGNVFLIHSKTTKSKIS
jgi:hypothetical protein